MLRLFPLIAMLYSFAAFAYCPSYPTITQEFEGSHLVFIGTVSSEQKVHESGDYFDGINYQLSVSEQFRGVPSESISLFSENTSGRFPMDIGASYLIFTTLTPGTLAGEPVYVVDYCGHSGAVASRPKTISAVRAMRRDSVKKELRRAAKS